MSSFIFTTTREREIHGCGLDGPVVQSELSRSRDAEHIAFVCGYLLETVDASLVQTGAACQNVTCHAVD